MNRLRSAGALALAMVLMTAGSALAQQPQPCAMMKDHQMGGKEQQEMPGMGMGMMKQDKQMGGMQQQGMGGMGMMEMCQKMQGMSGDSTMLEGMKGQHQLMGEMKKHLREMKKHMQMMDEKMDEMMEGMMGKMMMPRRQGMTPSGTESEPQEHHPAESK